MKKIEITTIYKKLLADVFTPVGIYLRLRDRFRDTILLESTDFHTNDDSYSFIGINAIAGIEITSKEAVEYKLPGQKAEKIAITNAAEVPGLMWDFMQRFMINPISEKPVHVGQGLFGYSTFDAVQFFDTIKFSSRKEKAAIPLMRYRLYQYVIAINHFKDELYICENMVRGLESEFEVVESLIRSKDVPVFPFKIKDEETSNMTDEDYVEMVKKGIQHCYRGDVFQIVLSRRFQQKFTGDEFNVYRALRNINPSPYLFYFDYGDYKLLGSSPESQLIIKGNKAVVHPIAGTFKRTGDDITDRLLAEKLLADPKENAEHVMLVDLARNDLSRKCDEVYVSSYRKVNYYSHVIHLVSEVTGTVRPNNNPFDLVAVTFPAGTLSGAPKYRAMQLIDTYERDRRGFYGGCLGFIGLNGDCNHCIIIRSFFSSNNQLVLRAGGGVVADSVEESEVAEVRNKLNALRVAIERAQRGLNE